MDTAFILEVKLLAATYASLYNEPFTLDNEVIKSLCEKFKKDWEKNIDPDLLNVMPFSEKLCAAYIFGYESALLRPYDTSFVFEINDGKDYVIIRLADLKFIKAVFPNLEALLKSHPKSDIWLSINLEKETILFYCNPTPHEYHNLLACRPGCIAYVEEIYEKIEPATEQEINDLKDDNIKSFLKWEFSKNEIIIN